MVRAMCGDKTLAPRRFKGMPKAHRTSFGLGCPASAVSVSHRNRTSGDLHGTLLGPCIRLATLGPRPRANPSPSKPGNETGPTLTCGTVSIAVTPATAGTGIQPEYSFTYDSETGVLLTRPAHSWRRHMPRFGIPISSRVARLARDPGTFQGTATRQLDKDQFATRVDVELPEELFSLAIQSFVEQRMLRMTGEVLRDGSRFELHNPRDAVRDA